MLPELTDAILRLKIAFASLSMKGLLFWEGLLFFKEEEYKKIIETKFVNLVNFVEKNDHGAKAYYQQILEDLREVRKGIFKDTETKDEVMKIRDAIISKAAYEMVIADMYHSAKQSMEKS